MQFISMLYPGVIICVYVALILVTVANPFWVFYDANKRGANGCLWGLIAFFGSWVGLLVYLAMRSSLGGKVKESPLAILQRRLARGEITEEEYYRLTMVMDPPPEKPKRGGWE